MDPLLVDVPEEFATARLLVRAPRVGDGAEACAAITESIAELRPWMPWAQSPPTVMESEKNARQARANFLARVDLQYRFFLRGTGTLVGASGLHRMDWAARRFEIGYWVRTRYAGQGYVTEAVAAIARMAFAQLDARRVEILVDPRNVRSWRVAERLGFDLEGTLRCHKLDTTGQIRDTRVYARVRPAA